MIESVKDYSFIMLDTQGRVVNWNEGARRIFGCAEAEIIGHSVDRFLLAEDIADGRLADLLARAAAEGRCEDEGWRVRSRRNALSRERSTLGYA